MKELRDYCVEFIVPQRDKPKEFGGNTPWCRIEDIQGKYLNGTTSGQYVTDNTIKKMNLKVIPKGAVICSCSASLGVQAILTVPCVTNQTFIGIVPNEKLDSEFLYYFLKSKTAYFKKIGTGTTIPYISRKKFEHLIIPEMSLVEQSKVVEVLRRAENVIKERREEIQKLDELIKARFVEMFGDVTTGNYKYETRKLGDVANVGSSHRVFTTEFVEEGIPFYRGTEIGELANGIKPTEPYYISEEHYNRLANDDTKPQIGDLLMPSICNKGQVWMVDTDEPFYYKDGRVLCISPDRGIFDTKYLEYFMRTKTLVEYPKLGSGSTFAEFKIFLLKDIDVLIPPRELQNQFADFVRQVDKSKAAVQKALDEAQLLFDSLMQQYFG